jgi:outer membrane protein assembly factor BamA
MKRCLLLLFAIFFAGGFCRAQQGHDAAGRVVIRHIIIDGNHTTRRAVILRELDLHEGDSIRRDSIDVIVTRNRLRLFNLQLFNEVDQHTEATTDGLDWYISVKERWYIIPSFTLQFADRNFNTWWVEEGHDLRRLMAGMTLTDKNFRGDLETLSATVQVGYTQKIGINYQIPYIDKGQVNGIGFSLSAAQSRQTWYNTDSNKLVYTGTYTGPAILRQYEAGVSYIYRPAYASRHIFSLSYKDYSVADTVVRLNPDYYNNKSTAARFVELFYRFEYNGVDNWNYSLQGNKIVAYALARQGFQGINFQSLAHIELGMFREPVPGWYYSLIFRGRVMYPQDQPYYFRSGLGTQTDYVRGYEYYVIDGSSYGLLRLDIKRELFNHTYATAQRYFTAIPLRIYPKVFADAGYIDSPQPGNSFLSNKLQYSAGIGCDIVTLYDIKIRLEFAYNHLAQNGLYLHFNSE